MSSNEQLVTALYEQLLQEIIECAAARKTNIIHGAETPELAALLVEKYGHGMARALKVLANLANCAATDLTRDVDELVLKIDPCFSENRARRRAARPAGLGYRERASQTIHNKKG